MSERRSNHERPGEGARFSFSIGGREFNCDASNTNAYLHDEQPQYDHLYIRDAGYLFRRQMTNFDAIAEFMENNGYHVNRATGATMQDFQAYHKIFGYDPIPPLDELTPRREKQVQFAKYLLDQEIVNAEDFDGDTI